MKDRIHGWSGKTFRIRRIAVDESDRIILGDAGMIGEWVGGLSLACRLAQVAVALERKARCVFAHRRCEGEVWKARPGAWHLLTPAAH